MRDAIERRQKDKVRIHVVQELDRVREVRELMESVGMESGFGFFMPHPPTLAQEPQAAAPT